MLQAASKSSVWKKAKAPAYESLKFYQDICAIRLLVHEITESFQKKYVRLVSQMQDAARSAKQNIREGYRRGTAGEFIRGIKISQASLEELMGDVDDCKTDGLISEGEFNQLTLLYQSAHFMSDRYLFSLYKMKKDGSWKVPGARLA